MAEQFLPSIQTKAFRFVLMIGIVSLFADMTYEGSRSIVGPYLAQLGASGTAVGIVAGLGELLGYALRYISGRVSEKTGRFWQISMGVHESMIPAAVAMMAPKERRASAYGIFTAGYGISWFLGSAIIGMLYDTSLPALIAFCIIAELAAIPFLLAVRKSKGS